MEPNDTTDTSQKALFWTPRRVLEVLGIVVGIAAGGVALYQFFFAAAPAVASSDIILQAEWDSFIVRENQSIAPGEELRGNLNPSTWLELSLQNKGSVPVENLAIRITGNARTEGEPSEFFEGQQGQKKAYLLDSVWRARPGVVLQPLPGGASETVGLSLTTLRLGRFTWGGRTQGLYHLKILVSGSGMAGPAEFQVTLRPFTRD